MSAVASVSTSGVLPTGMPRSLAASRSMLSVPTARLATAFTLGAASSRSPSTRSVTVVSSASACCARSSSASGGGGVRSSQTSTSCSARSRSSAGNGRSRLTKTRGMAADHAGYPGVMRLAVLALVALLVVAGSATAASGIHPIAPASGETVPRGETPTFRMQRERQGRRLRAHLPLEPQARRRDLRDRGHRPRQPRQQPHLHVQAEVLRLPAVLREPPGHATTGRPPGSPARARTAARKGPVVRFTVE